MAPSIVMILFIIVVFIPSSSAQLDTSYYCHSCPMVYDVVEYQVKLAIDKEKRMGASLLRLFFHDCFVNGCDASVLLDDTPTFVGEKTAAPNTNSIRGFEVIDTIKAAVEHVCPGVVSCADILAIAARDSVLHLGGPSWEVKLGRRDSMTASQAAANMNLPQHKSNLSQLVSVFQAQGLSSEDMVALLGSHTIGQARCTTFRNHAYIDTNINTMFASKRQTDCPRINGVGDDNLAPLDKRTPNIFDNGYYKNLISKKGLLHSDQELYNGGSSTNFLVRKYSRDANTFYEDFSAAMIKMGDIKPLVGSSGQIRMNCRKIN